MIAVVLFVAWMIVPRYLDARQAAGGRGRCRACHAKGVRLFAPECYRCEVCCSEWGDGLEALARGEVKRIVSQLSPVERRAYAAAEIGRAEARLMAAEAALVHMSQRIARRRVFGTLSIGSDVRASQEALLAKRSIGLAGKHLLRAGKAIEWLRGRAQAVALDDDVAHGVDPRRDALGFEIAGHCRIEALRRQAALIRERVLAAGNAEPHGTRARQRYMLSSRRISG
jgi:hypothetical protein